MREDVVSTINQIVTDSFNKEVDYMTKAIDKIQGVLTGQCKTLEEKVSRFNVDNASMDTSSSADAGECIIYSVVNPQAAKHGTSDVFGVLKELEDHNKRNTNFLIYQNQLGLSVQMLIEKLLNPLFRKFSAKINKVERLGKHKENSSRPLLVSMADESSKWQYLKQAL